MHVEKQYISAHHRRPVKYLPAAGGVAACTARMQHLTQQHVMHVHTMHPDHAHEVHHKLVPVQRYMHSRIIYMTQEHGLRGSFAKCKL